jgi:hypothetical protein
MEHQMDLLIDQSTWVPVLFRSSPVRSIRSRNYTQQQSPVSHRVTVKYRNHTQIPKNHPLDREKTPYFVGGFGMTALTIDNIVVVPIRSGVGFRLGANLGYLKFTPSATWNPF